APSRNHHAYEVGALSRRRIRNLAGPASKPVLLRRYWMYSPRVREGEVVGEETRLVALRIRIDHLLYAALAIHRIVLRPVHFAVDQKRRKRFDVAGFYRILAPEEYRSSGLVQRR